MFAYSMLSMSMKRKRNSEKCGGRLLRCCSEFRKVTETLKDYK